MQHPFSRPATLLAACAVCIVALPLCVILSPGGQREPWLQPEPSITFRRPLSADVPVRLIIPRIGVDAFVESVGMTQDGAMDVPKDPDNVGWYGLGVRPGEDGSAVFAGHVDWYDGKTAVFRRLDELSIGDVLSVETVEGTVLSFVVREVRTFESHEHAQAVFAKSDERHLNLITCDGAWDIFRKMYTKRLVVFTDAVDGFAELVL